MTSGVLAHDGNLGLQVDDPAWRLFLREWNLEPVAYLDMAELTRDLEADRAALAYLPAADDFYLRADTRWEGVATAVFAADGGTDFDSLLVVAADGVTRFEQLRGQRLGYVHRYCTSTYLAPALLCQRHGESLGDFFGELVVVKPYQAQIEALVDGLCDVTMLEEDVWLKTPLNAQRARVIDRQAHLPTPVFIAHTDLEPAFRAALDHHLLTHRPQVTPTTMFAGFVPFEHEQVQTFFEAGAQALSTERHT